MLETVKAASNNKTLKKNTKKPQKKPQNTKKMHDEVLLPFTHLMNFKFVSKRTVKTKISLQFYLLYL